MIHLSRIDKPKKLALNEAELTKTYFETGKRVWNQTYIKEALITMSNGKCCYCECNITTESKYLEVEHFLPKKTYPDLVVEWTNLLPSCKRCNGNKGNHDPNREKIINPAIDNPVDYLQLRNYRLMPKNKIAKTTINTLYLNDSERLVLARYSIGNLTHEFLQDLLELSIDYQESTNKTQTLKNKVVNRLKALLKTGTPEKEFASTVATVILTDDTYEKIKFILQQLILWDDELVSLDSKLKTIALI